MNSEDRRYFEALEDGLADAMAVANRARERGGDPAPEVEIPVAKDMADRVENILGIDGVAQRVRELEGEMSREEAALALVSDFVEGTVGEYETRAGKVEGAVRTAVALLTEGVVAAPIEGIDRVELLENDDGTEFINVYYAGPIRSAGGTAQALSVLVADYARALLGIEEYKARDDEIGRYAEEVALYDEETGLQYAPKEKEAKFIAKHMPIMLDGEATGDEEVSGYRDLDRVGTNSARGGMCLVLGEGIALKAPKIQRYTRNLEEISWPWLQDLIDGNYGTGGDQTDTDEQTPEQQTEQDADEDPDEPDETSASEIDSADTPPRADPSKKFLQDLIAGRPVFGHPSETGGFRLRYGRARNHGHATAGIHPATMHLVDDFLAPGTQIKTERPGKAAGIVPVDTIEGPTVRLANGDVRRIDDRETALELRNGVERILDLGEYLVNYGEFVENNHPLAPASYTFEWWIEEFRETDAPLQALADSTEIDLEHPTVQQAIEWATEYDLPLHPDYTYLYHDLTVSQCLDLAGALDDAEIVTADGARQHGATDDPHDDDQLVLPHDAGLRAILETLLIEHTQQDDRLTIPVWRPLVRTLGFDETLSREWTEADLSEGACQYADGENAIRLVNEVAPFSVRERAPTRIGNRMGRPEKSEKRELSPAVHTLFPIGEAGGSQRSVEEATQHGDELDGTKGKVTAEVGRRECRDCETRTFWPRCPACGGVTDAVYLCPDCDRQVEPDESGRAECSHCEILASPTQQRTLDVGDIFQNALDAVGERTTAFDTLKAVKGLSSETKAPEPLEKGILRAKHDVSAFKDGTIRYDMTDLPVTAVRPAELDVTAEQFRELGYETDVRGELLRHDDQVVELKVQDIVLSDGAAEFLLRTADFVDDLLTQYYGLDPYYQLESREDLVGELVFGMAPHTSAATVGRVVGFTSAAVGYAHPYFHAAKRRNCFHPETNIWYQTSSGEWQYEPIRTVVESHIEDPETDSFGTLIEELDGQIRVPSLTADGDLVTRDVTAVSKHPAPDHLLRIETQSGRVIRVTNDHDLQVHDGGSLTNSPATEIEPGDNLVVPDTLDAVIDGTPRSVDLLTALREAESIDDQQLVVSSRATSSVTHWSEITASPVPESDTQTVRVAGTSVAFPRQFRLDTTAGEILGEHAARELSGEHADSLMTVFEAAFDLGDSPETRRVPQCLFGAPERVLAAYLRGVFTDGTVGTDPLLVQTSTASKRLSEDLLACLDRLGMSARVRQSETDQTRYTVAVTGEDAVTFTERVGVQSDSQMEALRTEHSSAPSEPARAVTSAREPRRLQDGQYRIDPVASIEYETPAVESTYCLTVAQTHSLVANDTIQKQCDGDEDCVMLLMDGLLNFSRTFLPDKRGGSVAEDARLVAVDPDGNVRFLSFEEFWSRLESPVEHDGKFRKRSCYSEGWQTYAFDENGNTVLRPVEKAIRYRADDDEQLRRVETRCGRSLAITAHHSLFRYDDGIETVAGTELEPGDLILAPATLDIPEPQRTFSPARTRSRAAVTEQSVEIDETFGWLLGRRFAGKELSTESAQTEQPDRARRLVSAVRSVPCRSADTASPHFPSVLLQAPVDAVRGFLRGFVAAESGQSDPELTAMQQTVSGEQLKDGLVFLLHRLGLVADIEPDTDQTTDGQTRYTITVTGASETAGELSCLRVEQVESVEYDGYLYDLQVGGDPVFTANWLYAHNSMDAPLVMSSRIDPTEIDDEAHNIDIMSTYPKEFYEATRELAEPGEIEELMTIAEETLGTDQQYSGFRHTHDTTDIAAGPDLSAYKTLGSMQEKMDAQLALSRKLRAVDETDVAERIIEFHFLPDLLGNLKAFASQEVRCLDCGEKYRRAPLSGECRHCGGDITLTVHEGSVNKYMDTAIQVAEEFDTRKYTKQRLEVLEKRIERIFEDDTNKQSGIADFM